MGKFDGVLLASDFDDTLVSSDCVLSPGNRAALEYFTREGGRFTVSTGRARRTFAPYASSLPINAPVVLSNGAVLLTSPPGGPWWTSPSPPRRRRTSQP